MSEIQSRPYQPSDKCCEACVFGRGQHAWWCAESMERNLAALAEEEQRLAEQQFGSVTCWYCHAIIPNAPARHATAVQRIPCPDCGRRVWIPPAN